MSRDFLSKNNRKKFLGLSIASLLMTTQLVTAQAETVRQAMSYAYANSPQIMLEREKLRLSEEGIISAQAGLYPSLNGELSLESSWSRAHTESNGWLDAQDATGVSAGLSANYTLWDNGITQNRIAQAEIGKAAQIDAFANAEQTFLLNVFTIYVDVLRDSALLNAQIKNFNVLSEQQKASEARFQVGEATATDVSLAKARKAGASSSIAAAKAQLDASRAIYEQYVGRKPRDISQPKQIKGLLPQTLSAALIAVENYHPAIKSLKKAVLVAEKSVNIADAGLFPTASAFGSASQQISIDGEAAQTSLRVGAKLSIPIFNGGIKTSQIRQEKIRLAQARLNLTIARAQMRANVKARWAGLLAAETSSGAADAQIRASSAVLNGIRAEADEGVRTSFDVLNSEQELLSARVQSIVSQRSVLVSQMQLLSAIGHLSAVKLGIN
ncbi:MAG: TolC family outer membrane protein [Alphaproteobacteria bacterium]|nr:TolC family outer membrane protein [Alphaproteobacteria bacterium]